MLKYFLKKLKVPYLLLSHILGNWVNFWSPIFLYIFGKKFPIIIKSTTSVLLDK